MLYTSGEIECLPQEVGYDVSRIEVLHSYFQKLIDEKMIQGASYSVSRYGKTFMQGALGPISYRDPTTPLLPTTVHRIASITKVFTTIAIAKLVEDGMIRFDEPVGSILKQFDVPPFNKIDIFSLLTHTSGLFPDYTAHLSYHRNYWDLVEQYFDSYKAEEGELDWISAALSGGMSRNVGEEWQYSTFGFIFLGEIIKKVTGMSAEQYIEEQIAKPLGMKDTMFNPTQDLAKRCIIRHERQEKFINGLLVDQKPEQSPSEMLWSHVPDTGGGLFSTLPDLMKLGNMLLGMGKLGDTRILGRKTVEKITARALFDTPDYCWGGFNPHRIYALGFDMRTGCTFIYSPTTYGHEGAGSSCILVDPVEQVTAVWFVPFVDGGWHAEALYNVTNIIWSGLS